MILTCPQCSTRYQADAAKFSPNGRSVRCAKCGHTWHQDAPSPEPEPEMEAAIPEPEPVRVAPPRPAAYAPSPTVVQDEEEQEEPRLRSPWPMRIAVGAGWLGLVALVLLIGWSAVAYREQIATLWPQSSSLYATLGMRANASGIDFEDVAWHKQKEDGQTVLAITGKLVNRSSRELPVPQIFVALIDDDRRVLYHWTFVPSVMTLRSGQAAKFLTRLSNPPATANHFEVRFAKAGE